MAKEKEQKPLTPEEQKREKDHAQNRKMGARFKEMQAKVRAKEEASRKRWVESFQLARDALVADRIKRERMERGGHDRAEKGGEDRKPGKQ